jgi:hypothetical protein
MIRDLIKNSLYFWVINTDYKHSYVAIQRGIVMKKGKERILLSNDHQELLEVLGKQRGMSGQQFLENLVEYKLAEIIGNIDDSKYYSQVYGPAIKELKKYSRRLVKKRRDKQLITLH